MNIPRIQMKQEYGQLGIDADLGQQELKQPRATFELTTTRPKQEIHAEAGKLYIDQSKAFDAVGHGPHLDVMNQIYSQASSIALQGIAKIVENGNRMAQISNPGNAFAEIAQNQSLDFFEFDFMGSASFDNVDLRYEPGKLDIQVQDGQVNLETHPNRPEHEYYRGKLDIYVAKPPSLEIIPPQIDARV